MGRFLFYMLLGTAAAAAIVTASMFLQSPKENQADAQVLMSGNTPLQQTASLPIRRCMNMGGALEAPREGDWGYKIRAEDFKRLKLAGFDTVRVPIKFSAHTDNNPPYRISPDLIKRVDQIVDWAIVEGLQIIIDVHHYEELMQNPYVHEPRLEAMWTQIAYHYAKAPNNLMFELINEPNDKMTIERTDQLNRRLLNIVRQHNPGRWVIIGSAGWGNLDALMKSNPPRDPRVMTTFHFYDPFEFTHQGATWVPGANYPTGVKWSARSEERAAIASELDKAARWRDKTRMPMLLGEFGAINKADTTSRARWAEVVRVESERRQIGWCYWEYATGFPAFDLKANSWIPQMHRALGGR